MELKFGDVGFCGRRKTGQPGEKRSEQGENQQQNQLAYDTGPKLNLGHIGGRRSLSALRHPGSPVCGVLSRKIARSLAFEDNLRHRHDVLWFCFMRN